MNQKQFSLDSERIDHCTLNFDLLCKELWPVLAVIGGVDRGLRIGGACTSASSEEIKIVLGSLKQNLPIVKLLGRSPYLSVRYITS